MYILIINKNLNKIPKLNRGDTVYMSTQHGWQNTKFSLSQITFEKGAMR